MAKKTSKKSTSSSKANRPPTKAQVQAEIADKTGLAKRDVGAVLDELTELARKNLGRRGPREFTIPGLCKLSVKEMPAQKKRTGRNPATGETITIPAKPKRKTVKLRALKNLKEMAT